MHRPTPDSPTDRRERLCAGCRTERDAHAPDPLAHHSWPERVAEKVELKGRMVLAPTLILAIDDFRLFRMQRQSAFSKPRRKSSPQCCGLVFITTVTDRIIGRCRRDLCWNLIGAVSDWMRIRGQAARSIGLSASFWVRLCHPSTLRIVI